jgi:DNA-binding response OmpR family regulator
VRRPDGTLVTYSVLIVDDSLTVRMDLHEAFEADGFVTVLCATGEEARAAFADAHFEAAVLDILLPDADGVELLRELKSRPERADTVTVLLSDDAEVHNRLRGLRTGADEYVGKPYDAGYVVARVRQLLGHCPDEDARTTVLVIDDSTTFREQLRELLEPEGYAVLTAGSGEDGLRLAIERRPSAIIVDGIMPGIDGATVIRRVRLDPALRNIPCLLMTASDDYATELQMLDAGADGFIRKQQNLAVVLAKLAAVLRHGDVPLPIQTGSVHGPHKTLAVDTDRARLTAIGDALRDDGYDVIAAVTGDDALELLAAQPVACIVVGLDDGRAGPDICRRIKEIPQIGETPLVMTGDRDEALMECLAAGADDFVRAADGPDALRAHVRAQIRRKQLYDEGRRIREELMRRELDAAEERAARRLAETRAKHVDELEWRNRELEAFSGSVSHDLRGPLQVISSYAESLLDGTEEEPLGPVAKHRLQRIHAAAMRMADLVESLLILAKTSRGNLRRERFDLTAVANQVVADVRAREPERHVTCIIQDGMSADADEGLVRVILENLLSNAWKFTRRVEHPVIEVGWTTREPVRYFVRDNGAGFPPGKSGELFRPFARLHSADDFPGTGIGLTTVHRAVDRHGGEIHAEGAEGEGATFWFTLPNRP